MNPKKLFLNEVQDELSKYRTDAGDVITEQDLAPLPEPVQRFFRHCGYLGKPKMRYAEVEWGEVKFKTTPDKGWMALKCRQFNFVPEPARIVYLSSKIMAGRDKYQDGRGYMLIRLLGCFTVADAHGVEMDQSGLVTVLAETFLVPSYALQPYIKWTSIDSHTARASIKDRGIEVSGLFYFDDDGKFIRFDTNDRYYGGTEKPLKKVRWSGIVSDYGEKNGVRFPSQFSAVWHMEQGDYEYFRGRITDVRLG